MPKYLTPAAYRMADDQMLGVVGIGGQPPSIPDITLANIIQRAENAIDSFWGFDLKVGGFEPHTIGMWKRGFDFGTRRVRFPSAKVPVRNIKRFQILISQSGTSGNPLIASFLPGEVVINDYEDYLELVALTVTYSMAGVIWNLGLKPPIVEVDCEVGYYLPFLSELLYDLGDHQTFQAMRGFWASTYTSATANQPLTLPPIPPVAYINGTAQPTAQLSAALAAGTPITSLAVNALTVPIPASTTMTLLNATGGSSGVTVTTSAPASVGAVALPINSFTPASAIAANTILTNGYTLNLSEGRVIFATSQNGATVTADYTATIPDVVRNATIDQVTWLLQQRLFNATGLGGLEQVRNGQQFVRKSRTDDAEEDQLCAKARLKLQKLMGIAVG